MAKILKTFDSERLLIKEYKNWYLILRNEQVTLGSLVLIEKSFQTKYSLIPDESFVEFGLIVKEVEKVLKDLFQYDKINYLMLMMADDEVHYHIIPRYSKKNNWNSLEFLDFGWPKMVNFNFKNNIDRNNMIKLKNTIKNRFI